MMTNTNAEKAKHRIQGFKAWEMAQGKKRPGLVC